MLLKSYIAGLVAILYACSPTPDEIAISQSEIEQVGEKIYLNECAGKRACLTSWNRGEAFPSLGIGHFIWYPNGTSGPFKESFPDLIRFMQRDGIKIPTWLTKAIDGGAPWHSRDQFLAAQHSPSMEQLRSFLDHHKPLQVRFMVARLNRALPEILASIHASERDNLQRQFQRVAKTPMGYYALIDYVNFKGEGTKASERYQGKGWGLLQVLQNMNREDEDALHAFASAADRVLTRRVALSPPERSEERWLAGWRKRLSTYHPTDMTEN